MAVYICNQCLFCFERTDALDKCPDCGRMCVREADNDEVAEYLRNKAEFEKKAN